MEKRLEDDSSVRLLASALLTLKTEEEMLSYLEDICTINEIRTIAQRNEVAGLLRHGKTYVEIAEKTGASTATISRVNRSMALGGAGYDLVYSRLPVKKNG